MGATLQPLVDGYFDRALLLEEHGYNSFQITHAFYEKLIKELCSEKDFERMKDIALEVNKERVNGYCSILMYSYRARHRQDDVRSACNESVYECKQKLLRLVQEKEHYYMAQWRDYQKELEYARQVEVENFSRRYIEITEKTRAPFNTLARLVLDEIGSELGFLKDMGLSGRADYVLSKPFGSDYKIVFLYSFREANPPFLSGKYSSSEPLRYTNMGYGITPAEHENTMGRFDQNKSYLVNNQFFFPVCATYSANIEHYSKFETLAEMEMNIRCNMLMYSFIEEDLLACFKDGVKGMSK